MVDIEAILSSDVDVQVCNRPADPVRVCPYCDKLVTDGVEFGQYMLHHACFDDYNEANYRQVCDEELYRKLRSGEISKLCGKDGVR